MTEPDATPPNAAAPAEPAAALPEPRVIRSKRPRLSLVWLVPLLALAIGAAMVVHSILKTGPRIEIEFRTAEGLEAGKTEVRYKEVVIGRVQSVTLHDDRQRVIAVVQLDRSAAGLAVEDTSFWVVRPRVGLAGVSGISTLLSGAYIGVDAGQSSAARSQFVGLETAPYVLRGEPGEVFILRARDLGSLDIGSPIYYRRARVGRVVGYKLDAATDELTVKVFIEAPYPRLVTPHTRFWNASGIDLSIDANGLTLNTQAVASMLAGGVAFEQPEGSPRDPPAAGGSAFTLFADRKTALAPDFGTAMPVRLVFDGSLRGLSVGAPIDFLGQEIGQVRDTSLTFDAGRQRYAVQVLADLYPARLAQLRAQRSGAAASSDLALLQRLVDNGLRAQLRTGNLITGQLFIAMDFHPKARAEPLVVRGGLPTLPTVPGALLELQSQVGEIVAKVARVPFDEIGSALADALRQADSTMKDLSPEARKALGETQRTLGAAREAIAQLAPEAQRTLVEVQRAVTSLQQAIDRLDRNLLDEHGPTQQELAQSLAEVQRAAQSLRQLGDLLQRHPESLLRGAPADPALPQTGRSP